MYGLPGSFQNLVDEWWLVTLVVEIHTDRLSITRPKDGNTKYGSMFGLHNSESLDSISGIPCASTCLSCSPCPLIRREARPGYFIRPSKGTISPKVCSSRTNTTLRLPDFSKLKPPPKFSVLVETRQWLADLGGKPRGLRESWVMYACTVVKGRKQK